MLTTQVFSVSVHFKEGAKNGKVKNRSEVELLQEKVKGLEFSVNTLTSQFMEEKSARCALQSIIKRYMSNVFKDVDSIDWPAMETNII